VIPVRENPLPFQAAEDTVMFEPPVVRDPFWDLLLPTATLPKFMLERPAASWEAASPFPESGRLEAVFEPTIIDKSPLTVPPDFGANVIAMVEL
jgi:hypothetical protein